MTRVFVARTALLPAASRWRVALVVGLDEFRRGRRRGCPWHGRHYFCGISRAGRFRRGRKRVRRGVDEDVRGMDGVAFAAPRWWVVLVVGVNEPCRGRRRGRPWRGQCCFPRRSCERVALVVSVTSSSWAPTRMSLAWTHYFQRRATLELVYSKSAGTLTAAPCPRYPPAQAYTRLPGRLRAFTDVPRCASPPILHARCPTSLL